MKPYAPLTNKGRAVALDDIHHREKLDPRYRAAAAKAMRHSARQQARREALGQLAA